MYSYNERPQQSLCCKSDSYYRKPNPGTWLVFQSWLPRKGALPHSPPLSHLHDNKFGIIKDLNLFVRKLSLKTLYHGHSDQSKGLNTLLKLKMSECRELKDLLTQDLDPVSLQADSDSLALPESPDVTSTPLALLEQADPIDLIDQADLDNYLAIEDPLKPSLNKFKPKSTPFPPSTTKKNANLFLKQVSQEILTLETPPPDFGNLRGTQSRAYKTVTNLQTSNY